MRMVRIYTARLLDEAQMRMVWLKAEMRNPENTFPERLVLRGRFHELKFFTQIFEYQVRIWNPWERRLANLAWLFRQPAQWIKNLKRRI